jgi:hypothetical protein
LVFYSPLLQHQEFNNIITEPDVWPTVLGLTNHPFSNTAMGRNVFAIEKNKKNEKTPHYAFSYVYYSDPLIIMLYDQQFLAYGTEKEVTSLHLYMSDEPKVDVKNKYPEKFNEMRNILNGIFETSKYVLHHNKR